MMQITKRFLLVDDDPLSNYLTKSILKKLFEKVQVNDFTIPEDGLEFMKSEHSHSPPDGKITLFLDLNLNTISAWEYLEQFELFDASIKEQYDIYILSSSINKNDINLAKANPLVIDFLEKPISKAILVKIFG